MTELGNTMPSDQDSSGRSFDREELDNLREVMSSGTLFGPKGKFVKRLEADFSVWSGLQYAVACSSGTAAIHTALSAFDIGPGDEVITTPITDIGALTPILYQGGIPVFCDVDPSNGNVTVETIRERITERTRAIIVTHLLGNPADVIAILALADEHDIPVLEDCAQAFGATVHGRNVGRFGRVGAFSLQQGKHITSGEGGLIVSDDEDLARHMRLYVNKAWDYDTPGDHDFLALNYRMTELEAAVATAQLERIDGNIAVRRANAEVLAGSMGSVPGVTATTTVDGADPSYWRVGLLVDPLVVPGGTDALAAKLRTVDVPAASRYIRKPAFQTRLFTEQKTLGDSHWPFSLASPDALDYSPDRYPGAFRFLSRILVVPWNERLTTEHIARMADAIAGSVDDLIREAA
jgi:dTDP-4-amino-4,6-dideoxygalactose transaminase